MSDSPSPGSSSPDLSTGISIEAGLIPSFFPPPSPTSDENNSRLSNSGTAALRRQRSGIDRSQSVDDSASPTSSASASTSFGSSLYGNMVGSSGGDHGRDDFTDPRLDNWDIEAEYEQRQMYGQRHHDRRARYNNFGRERPNNRHEEKAARVPRGQRKQHRREKAWADGRCVTLFQKT